MSTCFSHARDCKFVVELRVCNCHYFANIVAVMESIMPIQPMDWEIIVMKFITLIHPCRNANAKIIRKPTSPIPAPIPMMNFPILGRWLIINEPPMITEIPPRSATNVNACRISESRSAVAPPRFSIKYSIIVPTMPVDPVAPAIRRSVPPRYANKAAILLDFILYIFSEKIKIICGKIRALLIITMDYSC